MPIAWKTTAGAIGTLALGAGILAASFTAAFAAPTTGADVAPLAETHPVRGGEMLAKALSGLVDKGVITERQKAAILAAVEQAAHERGEGDRDGAHVRRFLGNVLELSAQYLDLPVEAITGQLGAGKSLAEIAEKRPGKSRAGLIDYLQKAAHERIEKAVAEGKITAEQAAKLRTAVDAAIVKVVDHEGRHPGKRQPS